MKSLSEKYSINLSYQEEREHLRLILEKIEKVTKKENFADSMEFILGALANNAAKANLRRIFFHAKGFNFETPEGYKRGQKAFSENFSYLNLSYYEKAMRLLNVKVDIELDWNSKRLLIHIQNTSAMSKPEESCLRRKLKKAMDYLPKDIHSLYLHFGDTADDESLGLAMVVDMMNKMGFDPQHFRLYSDEKYTKTRLEFPLHIDYTPIREQVAVAAPGGIK